MWVERCRRKERRHVRTRLGWVTSRGEGDLAVRVKILSGKDMVRHINLTLVMVTAGTIDVT